MKSTNEEINKQLNEFAEKMENLADDMMSADPVTRHAAGMTRMNLNLAMNILQLELRINKLEGAGSRIVTLHGGK